MRNCPFCNASLPDDKFACGPHWHRITPTNKRRIWSAYEDYQLNKIDITMLRSVQAEVIAETKRHLQPKPHQPNLFEGLPP